MMNAPSAEDQYFEEEAMRREVELDEAFAEHAAALAEYRAALSVLDAAEILLERARRRHEEAMQP